VKEDTLLAREGSRSRAGALLARRTEVNEGNRVEIRLLTYKGVHERVFIRNERVPSSCPAPTDILLRSVPGRSRPLETSSRASRYARRAEIRSTAREAWRRGVAASMETRRASRPGLVFARVLGVELPRSVWRMPRPSRARAKEDGWAAETRERRRRAATRSGDLFGSLTWLARLSLAVVL
jgi:hypothetical protein